MFLGQVLQVSGGRGIGKDSKGAQGGFLLLRKVNLIAPLLTCGSGECLDQQPTIEPELSGLVIYFIVRAIQ